MGDMYLGDIHIENSQNERKSKGVGGMAKMAIGAALVATGYGAAIGYPMLINGGKEVIENNEKVRYLLDLGGGRDITSEGTQESDR